MNNLNLPKSINSGDVISVLLILLSIIPLIFATGFLSPVLFKYLGQEGVMVFFVLSSVVIWMAISIFLYRTKSKTSFFIDLLRWCFFPILTAFVVIGFLSILAGITLFFLVSDLSAESLIQVCKWIEPLVLLVICQIMNLWISRLEQNIFWRIIMSVALIIFALMRTTNVRTHEDQTQTLGPLISLGNPFSIYDAASIIGILFLFCVWSLTVKMDQQQS